MEFNITLEISLGLGKLSTLASTIASSFNEKIQNEDFGQGIKQIIVSLVCVAPEYEVFFKSRKPKFVRGKKTVKKHGTEYEIDSLLTYDIKLDYQKVKVISESELHNLLNEEILNSISIIKDMKIEDFKFDVFEKECFDFFHQI
jgi:hypothetical protein